VTGIEPAVPTFVAATCQPELSWLWWKNGTGAAVAPLTLANPPPESRFRTGFFFRFFLADFALPFFFAGAGQAEVVAVAEA
jgi:hypothetical protein